MGIREWILTNIPRTAVIVEAGSADGSDTEWFSDNFKDGMIYAFEPDPSLYKETHLRVATRRNVELSTYALSDKTGDATFYVSKNSGKDWGSSSILKPKDHLWFHPTITFDTQINVKTINLDEWSLAKNIDKIDLMWLDMQGAEPLVLAAAPRTLAKTQYVYTEVSVIETYENVVQLEDFKKQMDSSGFEFVCIVDMWKDMGNVLFKNRMFDIIH
jgi:FkbM family methyltransferase